MIDSLLRGCSPWPAASTTIETRGASVQCGVNVERALNTPAACGMLMCCHYEQETGRTIGLLSYTFGSYSSSELKTILVLSYILFRVLGVLNCIMITANPS
jgi:hypothetical protein